jgi:TusA-related sulfurtransferase
MTDKADERGIPVAEAMPAISRAVSRLGDGQALEVITSDPESVLVLLAWSYASGNPLLDVRLDDDAYHFVIRRGATPEEDAAHTLPSAA